MDPLLVAKMIDEAKRREEQEAEAALGVNKRTYGRVDDEVFTDAMAAGKTQRNAYLIAGGRSQNPGVAAAQKLQKQPYLREQVAEKVREKKMMLLEGITEEKRNEAGLKENTSAIRDLQNVEDSIVGVDNKKVVPNIILINYDGRDPSRYPHTIPLRSETEAVAIEGIAREVKVQDFGHAKKIRKDRALRK